MHWSTWSKTLPIILALSLAALAAGIASGSPYVAAGEPLKDRWTATSRLHQGAAPNKYILDIGVGPINYKAPWKGITEWTEITPGWETAAAPWQWQSRDAEYNVKLKEDVTSGQIIEWSRNGLYVRLQPMALNWTNDIQQIQQIAMPQAASLVLDGLQAGWDDAYGNGRSLYFQLGNVELQKRLVIDSVASLPSPEPYIVNGGNPKLQFNFIFAHSNELTLVVNGLEWNGRDELTTLSTIAFRDSAGQDIFYWRQPVAWDSDASTFTPTFRLKKQGSSLYISVEVSKAWLDTAVFPVTIDPTLDLQVGASADDASRYNGTLSLTSTASPFWRYTTLEAGWGARWLGVTIAPGSTIDVAHITWTAAGNLALGPTRTIYGDDEASAATFSTVADFDARPRTTASASYDVPAVTINVEYDTSSLVSIVQEIIDIAGWASGNPLALLQEKGSTGNLSYGYSWDSNSTKAPKLHIEYTAGGGGAERRIVIVD